MIDYQNFCQLRQLYDEKGLKIAHIAAGCNSRYPGLTLRAWREAVFQLCREAVRMMCGKRRSQRSLRQKTSRQSRASSPWVLQNWPQRFIRHWS